MILHFALAILLRLPQHDAVATHCEYNDWKCLADYDARVTEVAMTKRDIGYCRNAVVPNACQVDYSKNNP
jgi:hypothetical protein